MNKRFAAFTGASLMILVAGCLCAQILWRKTHHRYDVADTGYYHGFVHANFSSFTQAPYEVHFEGRSASHWSWTVPTNFAYSSLGLTWRQGSGAEGNANVRLPAFQYRSSGATGVLNRAVLAEWLLGEASRSTATGELHRVSAIFGYLEDAARGSLPPPRHQSYVFEEPVHLEMTHFLLGAGVSSFVYVWIVTWLFLLAVFGRRLRRMTGAHKRNTT